MVFSTSVRLLLLVLLFEMLGLSCYAQCSTQVFTSPSGSSPPTGTPAGLALSNNFIYVTTPVQITTPMMANAVAVYPYGSQTGVMNIVGGVFTYQNDANQTRILVAQSEVVTLSNPVYNKTLPATPLQLPFSEPVTLPAGVYSVVYWYTWTGASFFFYTLPDLPYTQGWDNANSTTNFTSAQGRLPATLSGVNATSTTSPGQLVSVVLQVPCSSSSSTGSNSSPHTASMSLISIAVSLLAFASLMA